MDEWGFESGEELKVLEKKSGKRSSLPRFALPALLIAAGLLVVLALLWSAPLARETTAFRNRTAQDGLTYSYTIDQGVATACGVLAGWAGRQNHSGRYEWNRLPGGGRLRLFRKAAG